MYLHSLYTAVPCSVTPAYIFFHHRADFLSLHHKFLLLQSHLFFLSPLSQNILHRSVCHKIPLLQADYFLLTDYLQISVSLILSLPFNLPLQNTSSFTVIYTRNFLHKKAVTLVCSLKGIIPPRMSSHCYKLFDLFSFDFPIKSLFWNRGRYIVVTKSVGRM